PVFSHSSYLHLKHLLSFPTRRSSDLIKVDGLPLETFDARTRFALFWARLYGRQLAPKSEAVFQAMASNQRLEDVRRDILEENTKGYRLASFGDYKAEPEYNSLSASLTLINVLRH